MKEKRIERKLVRAVKYMLRYPQLLCDDDPEERELGITMGFVLLSKCQELWCFGNIISKGMSVEIKKAKGLGILIRYFNTNCVETGCLNKNCERGF